MLIQDYNSIKHGKNTNSIYMFLNSRKCKLGNVVDVAIAAGNFKTLLTILSELEVPGTVGPRSMTLVDFLKMQREVTIFAPTDEAFAKLPEGTLESLSKEQKLAIVSRHFVAGVIVLSNDIPYGRHYKPLLI